MGLFDLPLATIRAFKERRLADRSLRAFSRVPADSWRSGPEVILRDQTHLELGNPRETSLSLLLWTDHQNADATTDQVYLVGPDLGEAPRPSLPFAQVIIVTGTFEDAYESYRQLREAVYSVSLRGTMVRVMPSRQTIWYRFGAEALGAALDAQILGSALIDELTRLDFVERVEVLLVTSEEAISELAEAGSLVLDIVDALLRMHEQTLEMDCDDCEFAKVCDSVSELRRLHEQLQAGISTTGDGASS